MSVKKIQKKKPRETSGEERAEERVQQAQWQDGGEERRKHESLAVQRVKVKGMLRQAMVQQTEARVQQEKEMVHRTEEMVQQGRERVQRAEERKEWESKRVQCAKKEVLQQQAIAAEQSLGWKYAESIVHVWPFVRSVSYIYILRYKH